MAQALEYMLYIFQKTIDLLFNRMTFDYGTYHVSIGWILTSFVVFGILIGSILNIPHSLHRNAYFTNSELRNSTHNIVMSRRSVR